jgi:hypothetical protein
VVQGVLKEQLLQPWSHRDSKPIRQSEKVVVSINKPKIKIKNKKNKKERKLSFLFEIVVS